MLLFFFYLKFRKLEKLRIKLTSEILAFKLLINANLSKQEGMIVLTGVNFTNKENMYDTPASNLGYPAPPPGQFFMGAKLFIGTPWMGNEGVLKKIMVWAM